MLVSLMALLASWFESWPQWAVIGSLLLVQSGLILLLLLGRRKRSRLLQELHQLSGRLITAQEDERKRIARELHDDVTQLLALHSIELDQFTPSCVSPEDRNRFQHLSAKAAEIATEVHNIAHRLHPSKLHHLGLLPAVRELCRDVSQRHGLEVEVADDNMPADLGGDLTLCLYRVIQESLANVLRHSGASHALVSLRRREREITLTIADDGHGFDPASASAGPGIGLFSMRERLRLVSGRLSVDSGPGAGTEITVIVPLRTMKGAA